MERTEGMKKFEFEYLSHTFVRYRYIFIVENPIKKLVDLSMKYLTPEQIESVIDTAINKLKKPEHSHFASALLEIEKINAQEILWIKLYIVIGEVFSIEKYLSSIFFEFCDKSKIEQAGNELRELLIEQGICVADREELDQRFIATQSDLSKPREEAAIMFELKCLSDTLIKFGGNYIATLTKLSMKYLTEEQQRSATSMAIARVTKQCEREGKQLTPFFRAVHAGVESKKNPYERLYCTISTFFGSEYLCHEFCKLCDKSKIVLVVDDLRKHLNSNCPSRLKVPTREEIDQKFEAMKAQQKSVDEQNDLPEPQEETIEPHEEATTL
jgi:hypothetical protein